MPYQVKITSEFKNILSDEALRFLEKLHIQFNPRRLELLQKRKERHLNPLDFLKETQGIRNDPDWRVAEAPDELIYRLIEITGPTDRKMMINAMNSGANVFMADFEDSNSPTWDNMVRGQINICDAVDGTITFGENYALKKDCATLFVRPRGWHLEERHLLINGERISASLFDAGLYLFHNAKKRRPFLYLPKLESYLEARLWNDIFLFIQKELGLPKGTIRATVLIETLPAAFQMDEILYELKDHSAGLNAGRWDYIFSVIKTNREIPLHLPDRDQITMTTPFMHAYTKLLVKTCHKRGAQPIGGMSAFIPDRNNPEVTQIALQKVREDKLREIDDGFIGTWVAHPDLVPVVLEVFSSHYRKPFVDDTPITREHLLNFTVPGGKITEEGLKKNIRVAHLYLKSWLNGKGAVAIDHLMEDVATAEISRSQVWKWIQEGIFTKEHVKALIEEDGEAKRILESLIFADEFVDFLTILAGDILCTQKTTSKD
ncbi:MAG: malate synthase A [Waddliaceae bacterium]